VRRTGLSASAELLVFLLLTGSQR